MRTSSGECFEANGVKYTRATPMSGAILTAVIVTLPTRGSFTSRAITSASTRWISPSMRRLRCGSCCVLIACSLQRSGHFHAREALDLVPDTYVLIVLHADPTLRTGADFAGIVLEASQGLERALEDHDVVTQHADRVIAPHQTFGHQTARDDTELARAEHLAHLCDAHDGLLDLRLQHTGHHLFHIVDGLIDDAVVANGDACLLERIACGGIGTHIEADDQRFGGCGELHIRHGDATEAAGQHLDLNLFSRKLGEGFAQGFRASLHVRLDEDRYDTNLRLAHLREHVLDASRLPRELHVAELALPIQRHLAGLALALHDQ